MTPSDFELVLECVGENPGSTGRDIAGRLRRQGHERFTSKLANQVLYRLHAASMVERDASGEKPRWHPSREWTSSSGHSQGSSNERRPLDSRELPVRSFKIATTPVKVLLDHGMSSNDPYIVPDWVGSHIIATVNTVHPFWTLRLTDGSDRALYCMLAAVDAYVQWRVALLHEPPDATELQHLKDQALRFCTLIEAESSSLE